MLGKTTCFTLMPERGVGSRAVPLRIWNTFIARTTAVKQSSGKTRVFVIVLLRPHGFVIVPGQGNLYTGMSLVGIVVAVIVWAPHVWFCYYSCFGVKK